MILKSLSKINIKKTEKKKFFLISYFILTSLVGILFLIFFLTSYAVKQKTLKTLEYLSKAGRIEYIYILDIGYNAFKSNFYKLDKIDFEIKFDDIIVLEAERNKAIKNKSLGLKDNLTKIKTVVKHKNKKIESQIRLKDDRQIHFKKKNTLPTMYI